MSSTMAANLTDMSELVHKVELHISCKDLPSMDLMSASDPMVVVYIKEGTQFKELARTERIADNNSPVFITPIVMDYYFETVQSLKFEVWDADSDTNDLSRHDYIGSCLTTLGEIVGHTFSRKTFTLTNSKKGGIQVGSMTVSAEELGDLNANIRFELSATNLDKKDFFGKSDPYLVISKAREDGDWTPVHKTEVVMKNLNPTWAPFMISLQGLCGGDMQRPIKFECYDWDRSGSSDFIGELITDMGELMANEREFEFKDPAKRKKKSYKNSGKLVLNNVVLTKVNSFLDYIRGGCEISLMVAIDFTASNGDQLYSGSLHYQNPYQPNDYQKAIVAVGEIVANYDSDKRFPVWGFGAKVPDPRNPKGGPITSHCFPANFNYDDAECEGIQGVLDAYYNAVNTVTLFGPTNFAEVIATASNLAARHNSQEDQHYNILLILTDGEITDIDKTIDRLVGASELPLSVIIVGIGQANFANMERLDADVEPLCDSKGRQAKRDIVQFVPFRDFVNTSTAKLAEEVLSEIPNQFLSYMRANDITPNEPIVPPADEDESASVSSSSSGQVSSASNSNSNSNSSSDSTTAKQQQSTLGGTAPPAYE